MNGRETGCKTMGCVVGLVVVIAFFVALLNTADDLRDQVQKKGVMVGAKEKEADADFDLPLLYDGVRRYADDHADALPPLQTPDALRLALFPRYVSAADTFINARDNAPYVPNGALSGKKRAKIARPETVTLLSEATPLPATGARRVLRLDGSVAAVGSTAPSPTAGPNGDPPNPRD